MWRQRFTEPEKIEILLHEYRSLSDQIVQRFVGQMVLYGAVGAASVGLVAAVGLQWFVLSGGLFVVGLVGVWLWTDIDRDIAKATARIIEIEARINRVVGEPLLEWETKHGRGGVIGKRLPSVRKFSN
jgi:hypothetical protein